MGSYPAQPEMPGLGVYVSGLLHAAALYVVAQPLGGPTFAGCGGNSTNTGICS